MERTLPIPFGGRDCGRMSHASGVPRSKLAVVFGEALSFEEADFIAISCSSQGPPKVNEHVRQNDVCK